MKHPGARLLLSVWLWWGVGAFAAQPTNESFSAGANGWVGTSGSTPFGETGVWSFTGGAARVLFFNPGFPVPDSATLSNGPSASGGAFTGNYEQVGINRIGFSVLAPTVLPSGFVILEWAGSTSLYQRGFTVATTGVWHHFTASLSDVARGEWTVLAGSVHDFAAARQSVRRVTLRVSRNGLPAHEFVFDHLHLSGEPEAIALDPLASGLMRGRWQALNAGRTYHVEAATTMTGTWSTIQGFVATGAVHELTLTNAADLNLFWRMLRP